MPAPAYARHSRNTWDQELRTVPGLFPGENKERQKWFYGVMAGFVLLTGFALGSLATVCGMIVGPGRYYLINIRLVC